MSEAEPTVAEVSVVVVNWNSGDRLRRLVDSTERHPPALSFQVIVVDNASHDRSAELVDRPWLRVIRLGRNVGLAAANNVGIRSSAGPYLLICNPDVELPPGGVDHMAEVLERHPRCAWVVPRLVGEDGRRQTSAGDLPTLTEALLGRRLSRRLGGDPGGGVAGSGGMWWHDWPHDEEIAIRRGAEACYLVRRSAVEEIGLQDERFRLDWEGTEWAARAGAAGWEIWFDPATTVVHTGGVSIRQVPRRWVVQSHRGMYLYFAARTNPVWRPVLAAAVLLRAAIKLVGVATRRPLYDSAHRVGPDGHR